MTNCKIVSELNFDNIDTQSISNNLKFLSESFRFLSFNLQKYKILYVYTSLRNDVQKI